LERTSDFSVNGTVDGAGTGELSVAGDRVAEGEADGVADVSASAAGVGDGNAACRGGIWDAV